MENTLRPKVLISLSVALLCLGVQAQTLTESKTLLAHSQIRCISFGPDGSLLAGGAYDGTIVLWSVENGKEIRRVSGHTKQIRSLSFSADGALLASGGEDETIAIWSTDTWQQLRSFASAAGPVLDLSFSPDGALLAAVVKNRPIETIVSQEEMTKEEGVTVRMWSTGTWNEIQSHPVYDNRLNRVSFSPDGRLLAGYGGKNIRIWAVGTQKEMGSVSKASSSIAFSPDGKLLATSSGIGTISILSVEEQIEVRRLSAPGDFFPSVVRFSRDGALLASAGYEGRIRKGSFCITLWSADNWRPTTVKKPSEFVLLDLSFSPDGEILASISDQSDLVTLWSIQTSVAVSPDSPGRSLRISSENVPDPPSGSGSQVWAVVIGISEYGTSDLRLRYADRDAQRFFDFLRSPQGGSLPDDRITLLLNQDATRQNIIKSINDKLNRAFEEDMVMIYLACHGMPDPVGDEVYFLGYDAKPDNLAGTAVSQIDIEKALTRTRATKKLWIADACHSGGAGLAVRGNHAYLTNKLLSEIANSKEGLAMLTASSSSEFSQEDERWGGGHGVFTYFLLRGLSGAADSNTDGIVNVREVYEYVYRGVAEETGGQQHPELKGTFDNKMPLSVVR